jgi:hypothetical protein
MWFKSRSEPVTTSKNRLRYLIRVKKFKKMNSLPTIALVSAIIVFTAITAFSVPHRRKTPAANDDILPAPTIISPSGSAQFSKGEPVRFEWTAVPGAAAYMIDFFQSDQTVYEVITKDTTTTVAFNVTWYIFYEVSALDKDDDGGYPATSAIIINDN